MTSPIKILKQFVFPTLRRVAPEKWENLLSAIEQRGIIFQFIQGEARILFTADSTNGVISVGEKCLERLWATSYAYFLFYKAMCKAKHRDITVESIDIRSNPEIEQAAALLSWATSVDWQVKAEGKQLQTPLPNWPESLPKPIENPQKASNEDVADNLFLSAVGFILHHELAHIQLGHKNAKGVDSILHEKEADRAAAEWLLDGLQSTGKEFIQRIFGIAVAFLWTATLEAYVPSTGETHPPGYDRLYQTLSQFVDDNSHPVWSFVSIALTMHLDASGTQFDQEMQHQSPKDAVNHYCNVLSNGTEKRIGTCAEPTPVDGKEGMVEFVQMPSSTTSLPLGWDRRIGTIIQTEIEKERLLLDCDLLPEKWNCAYGITENRRQAFLGNSIHSDSFLKPVSETAMTVFMLGRLEGWKQAQLVHSKELGLTPRKLDGNWSSSFFRKLTGEWVSDSPRESALGNFLADRLELDPQAMSELFLLFEVRTFNNAFNGGTTIRNPSFLVVDGEWSRYDALIVLPSARMLIFIESKLGADGKHGAGGHAISQPIRNLETAFFITSLSNSKYRGWDFRYILLCPKPTIGLNKDCERFFAGKHGDALHEYDRYVLEKCNSQQVCADRVEYREQWKQLQKNLHSHLTVVYWSDMMDALCKSGFNQKEYLDRLGAINLQDRTIVDATKQRWRAAGIPL